MKVTKQALKGLKAPCSSMLQKANFKKPSQ